MINNINEEINQLIKDNELYILAYLKKYANNKGFTQEVAEDALQEAKIRAFSHFNQFDIKQGPFKNWFFKIALHCIIDRVKKEFNNNNVASLDCLIEDTGDKYLPSFNQEQDILNALMKEEELTRAFQILNKLPDIFREPLYKMEVLDMSYEELARDMNLSIPALRVRVCRAKKLAQSMAKATLE